MMTESTDWGQTWLSSVFFNFNCSDLEQCSTSLNASVLTYNMGIEVIMMIMMIGLLGGFKEPMHEKLFA